ncbi:hypothetical protein AMTR_s00105p00023990 [Amborella trichopoda]|uniref:Uncharacterized protein n=1 Tax=Amborella trichopoda TaxID=13333 RepID=W1NZ81_AMBTC|nr:hypothetical protein AMTR_s00105p00023990 [Amborella trichopoda]
MTDFKNDGKFDWILKILILKSAPPLNPNPSPKSVSEIPSLQLGPFGSLHSSFLSETLDAPASRTPRLAIEARPDSTVHRL